MAKIKTSFNLNRVAPLALLTVIGAAAIFTATRTSTAQTFVPEQAAASTTFPISLTTSSTAPTTGTGGFTLKADWQPGTGNDSQQSIFFWKGTDCKSVQGGYQPGDLIWSYGTINKSTYSHTSEFYKPGSKFCVQIWNDFYGGVVGSNPSVVEITTLKASPIIPSTTTENYGINTIWQPGSGNDAGSIFFWKGEVCKSSKGGYGPGDLIWSYDASNKSTYMHKAPQYQPGSKYCVQIWKDFYGGVASTLPVVVTIPTPSCTVTLTPNNFTMKKNGTANLEAKVSVKNGLVSQVNFVSSNTSIVKTNPFSDATKPYATKLTGLQTGNVRIDAHVKLHNTPGTPCQVSTNIKILP